MSDRLRLAARRLYRPLLWRLDELRAAAGAQGELLARQREQLASQHEALQVQHHQLQQLRDDLEAIEQARRDAETRAGKALENQVQQLVEHVHERFVALRAQLLAVEESQRVAGTALSGVERELGGPQELVAEWTQAICAELRELRAELDQLHSRKAA